jgi:hypothetical protein
MRGIIDKYASYKDTKHGEKTLRFGYYIINANGHKYIVHENQIKVAKEVTEFT